MKSIVSFWQKSKGVKMINITLDLASGPIYQPEPVDGDLYSSRFVLPRSRLGFGGRLVVPDASCVVVWGRGEFSHTFGPGVHSLRICPSGRLDGRQVDMAQDRLSISLSDLYTTDLARLSLEIDVEFKVDDPQAIIQVKSPLQTLTRMVEGITRQEIEDLPHRSLFVGASSAKLVNKAALERKIRFLLHTEAVLKGLRILSTKIVKVERDPTYLALETHQTRRRLAQSERELTVFQAETERLAASAREKAALDEAKRQAAIFELESTRREFKRKMEEMQLDHQQALARIKTLGQALAALADNRFLAVANGPYAQSNNSNGWDQVLLQVIDSLTGPQAIRVPTGSNGHGGHRVSDSQSASSFEE